MTTDLGIGLMGLGTVGQGVYNLIKGALLEPECPMNLHRILVMDPEKERPGIPREILTTHPLDLLDDPRIHIVVEVMGGLEPAREYLLAAMGRKKHVVTANKLLLATHGQELFTTAQEEGVQLCFEASVCAGVPIIKILQDALSFCPIEDLWGIVNGTTNYILTRMAQEGLQQDEALREAQDLGYAEAHPSSDIQGEDAACKLAILSSIAFGILPPVQKIPCQGITDILPQDLETAAEWGYVIKLMARARKSPEGLFLYVGPTLIQKDHAFAQVNGVLNAISLRGQGIGDLFFSGPGAGMMPTAYAVISDIYSIFQKKSTRTVEQKDPYLQLLEEGVDSCPFYLRLKKPSSSLLPRLESAVSLVKIAEKNGDLVLMTGVYSRQHLQQVLDSCTELFTEAVLFPIKGGEV